ncbi:hypothetical protein CI41S_09370 [Bradyrhizobium ivorense]|nr:hypothetical protein CI41S_09370 [Bradyrhizobium ivorense]
MHSSLAVTLEAPPLGLSAVKFWTRTKFRGVAALRREVNLTRIPIETKESIRGLENLTQFHGAFREAIAVHPYANRSRTADSSTAPERSLPIHRQPMAR